MDGNVMLCYGTSRNALWCGNGKDREGWRICVWMDVPNGIRVNVIRRDLDSDDRYQSMA